MSEALIYWKCCQLDMINRQANYIYALIAAITLSGLTINCSMTAVRICQPFLSSLLPPAIRMVRSRAEVGG